MEKIILIPEAQIYDVVTDSRLPASVRGRIAYEGFIDGIRVLNEMGAV